MNQEPKTWREYLAEIIATSKEKQRVAKELGVGTRTLERWVQGLGPRSSRPLNQLLEALPRHRDALTRLIQQDPRFAQFSPTSVSIDESFKELPTHFYARILETNANIADNLRFQVISTLILQQSLQLFDSERLGLEIIVVQCMKPTQGQKVRSLRERVRTITGSQQGTLEERLLYLGADSLAGHVVASCQAAVIQDVRSEHQFLPIRQEGQGKSLATYPIQRSGRVAGCFLVVSPQPDYFTRTRQSLLQCYAHLFVLAFNEEEFYHRQDIALGVIPAVSVQGPIVAGFRTRVANTLIEASRCNRAMSLLEAETLVQQQMEAELLKFSIQAQASSPRQ
jgi:hypothetical protein